MHQYIGIKHEQLGFVCGHREIKKSEEMRLVQILDGKECFKSMSFSASLIAGSLMNSPWAVNDKNCLCNSFDISH